MSQNRVNYGEIDNKLCLCHQKTILKSSFNRSNQSLHKTCFMLLSNKLNFIPSLDSITDRVQSSPRVKHPHTLTQAHADGQRETTPARV